MKKPIFLLVVFIIAAAGIVIYSVQRVSAQQSQQTASQQAVAEITFTFTRQTGSATNQFAVWVEDSSGRYVKTLFATQWTAKGGWRRRETSIPLWVRKSNLENMTNTQIDAVSGATPRTGTLTYSWDGIDNNGAQVPAGEYVIVLEGTLRWENQVIYRAPITLFPVSIDSNLANSQVSIEYLSDSSQSAISERSMITEVSVRTLR